jgi:hypothetical protein
MSLRNPWNRWKIGTLSLIVAGSAVYVAERLDAAQSRKGSGIQMLNSKSGKCISVRAKRENTILEQLDCNKPGAANRWIREDSREHPYFSLKLKGTNPGLCTGLNNGNNDPNTVLQLFRCDGKANQRWKIDGARIKNYDQLCIGVDQASVEDGALLKQFVCDDHSNQKWRMR